MNFEIRHNKLKSVINEFLKKEIDFDNLYFDWGYYNCGMGICCDIDYLALNDETHIHGNWEGTHFKICKNRHLSRDKYNYEDMPDICGEPPEDYKEEYPILIVENEDLEEELYGLFNDSWKPILVELINDKYGTKLRTLLKY